jgi:hypothetical protein
MKHWPPPKLESNIKTEDRRTNHPNFIAMIAVGVVGCLIAVGLTLYFPDLGLTVAQLNLFAGP